MLFSGKMIQSTTYVDSVERKELVPLFTLNKFDNPDEEWNTTEMREIFQRIDTQFNGNMKHNFVSNDSVYITLNIGLFNISKHNTYYFDIVIFHSSITIIRQFGDWDQKTIQCF